MIFSRAPLRVSLGGGGTDLPDHWRRHGGYLLSGAIDKYVYLLIHDVFQGRWKMKYSETEDVEEKAEIRHPILREALARHWSGAPLEIASVADVPAGTGLGSSGAFTVALLRGLALARRIILPTGDLAERAYGIEEGLGGGKQDPYASAYGGVCAYDLSADGSVSVEPLELGPATRDALRDHLLLFYVGGTRDAEPLLRSQARDEGRLRAAGEIAVRSRTALLTGDLRGFGETLTETWALKKEESPRTTLLRTLALGAGAVGAKLVGAGGSGFLMVLASDVDPVRRAMADAEAPELRFDFEYGGARAEERSG